MKPSPVKAVSKTWRRLIQFVSKDGTHHYGEPILPPGNTSINSAKIARIVDGHPFILGRHTVTNRVAEIARFKAPIRPTHVYAIRCLGLNYRSHAAEANLPIPEHPILFYKPLGSLCGPLQPIPIPLVAQDPPTVDYECELVVIIGKECKNVTEEEALDYVGGYCVGNDVSHREWQLQRGGGQWGFGKGFDYWAPFGPGIVRPELFGDRDPGRSMGEGRGLKIWTKLNGETVQKGWTGDMIFGVAKTISFLSQGTKLFPGMMIFMGTPPGVGMGHNPPLWLADGDVVEVGLEGVGSCVNIIQYES
ncbi:hypothetical protein K469DRAFT_675338 [Zopfia rhizophila CBS 207.26]|uniref:Fumarylacetoacetase-like C-terminal domain-containing protein n=1 Tax=Zopfia rhizophila CBS 207.26 TaxID=1314779 RepID=A0A6A6DJA7_9PEZI|nr:hypothetical protein K469DRAFT_675338 [Zopfia rhizophila CBS 207.26]